MPDKAYAGHPPPPYPAAASFSVPREVVDAGYAPGGELPAWIEEQAVEIDDHLRDMRVGLANVAAELQQIGQSTEALLSARLYWVEFVETSDGPDFRSELAEVGTKVRHLQRILAAAEQRSAGT